MLVLVPEVPDVGALPEVFVGQNPKFSASAWGGWESGFVPE